jgi:sialate O-acetylesterase
MLIRIVSIVILFGLGRASSGLDLPAIIADGMVLQRQAPVPIWGWGTAGEIVSVSFADQTVEGTVRTDGSWRVDLKPLKASSTDRSMTITVGTENVTLDCIVVGEVWLASGQSNMQVNLGESRRDAMDKENQPVVWAIREEASRQLDPLVRQLKVPIATSYNKEQRDFESKWTKADTEESKNQFSSVAYYFAKELRRELKVPVGIVVAAWGAKRIQPFIPSSQYRKNPELAKYYDEQMARMNDRIAAYDPVAEEAKFKAAMARWHERARQAKAAGKWPPKVPERRYPQDDPNFPGTIYNAMINPLVPYAIRGAIWYQGESNARHPKVNVFTYETYLRALIDGLRDRWGQGDFPVYYCQLAQFRAAPTEPIEEDFWVTVCNDMRKALDHKNVGMAVLNDCGEVRDIHPRNKIDPGKRLALWALANDYGRTDLVYSGPLYKSHSINGDKVTITFTSVGEGLMTARKDLHRPTRPVHEELGGFQICGKDGQWRWAMAKITGPDSVVVWHPDVKMPDEVRYAWAQNPDRANLYNKAGLPTSVFSTK